MNGVSSRCVSIAFTAFVCGTGCGQGDVKQTNFEFVPDMVEAVPYESFSDNPNTPDHKTLQAPPKGAVAMEARPFHYGVGPEEAKRAGQELKNPFESTAENIARGEVLYKRFCTPCHGTSGDGDGPVIPRFPTPPSLKAAHAVALPEGQLVHIISRGQGLMPSHATQISLDDRWKLVTFIRSLQKPGGAK